ncbi:MAG: hypothetical protein QNJ92_09735 [Alphaproteobacteria bacterium]|nr:hypothetical protein [Alphaproteobacteria bacterium]
MWHKFFTGAAQFAATIPAGLLVGAALGSQIYDVAYHTDGGRTDYYVEMTEDGSERRWWERYDTKGKFVRSGILSDAFHHGDERQQPH